MFATNPLMNRFARYGLFSLFFVLTLSNCSEDEQVYLPEQAHEEQVALRSQIRINDDQALARALHATASSASNARNGQSILDSLEEKTVLKTVDTLTNRIFYTIALTEGEDKPTYLIGTEYEGQFSFFLMSLMPEEAPFVGDSTDFRGRVELSFLDGTNKQYLTVDDTANQENGRASTQVCRTSVSLVTDTWLVTTSVGGSTIGRHTALDNYISIQSQCINTYHSYIDDSGFGKECFACSYNSGVKISVAYTNKHSSGLPRDVWNSLTKEEREAWEDLKPEEREILLKNPLAIKPYFENAATAYAWTSAYFPKTGPSMTDNNNSNAFKHALWNALNVIDLGFDLTKKLTTAHEAEPNSYWPKTMDLYNNEVGRQIGKDWSSDSSVGLSILCLRACQDGRLRRLNSSQNGLIPTNGEDK